MNVRRLIPIALLGLLVVAGCGNEALNPSPTPQGIQPAPAAGNGHPPLYTWGWCPDGERVQRIDTRTGRGTLQTLVDGSYGWSFGFAFDLDGSCYTMMNWWDVATYPGQPIHVGPEYSGSVLCRMDMNTGAVTPINLDNPHHLVFAGAGIDRHGVLYETGFTVGPPEWPDSSMWWGGYSLWRVNKATGALEEVGDTRVGTGGEFAGRWMDLAFDSQNRCWTTCSNKLFLLDTTDGHSTFVTDIIGVPQDNIPGDTCPEDWPYIEVMDIAFDEHDVLWGSAIRGFSWCMGYINAPLLRIDTNTGQATLVGYNWTGVQNHGGDIMPTRVVVAHRQGDGTFQDIDIAMEALPGHLAHGDYVPGTVGDPDYPR